MKIPQLSFKAKRACYIAAGILGVYMVAGFYILPALLKPKLSEMIQQQTGRKTSISKIQFNPFSMSASLQGFEIQEQSGQPLAAFDNLYVNIGALQSIIHTALDIEELSLQKPIVRIARQKDGAFNFQDLLKDKGDAKENGGKTFPVNIVKLSIVEGKLDWEDAHFESPEKETAYPVNLVIDNLTTQADKPSSLSLSLELNSGGKLDWQGTISLNPLSSSGHIKLEKVQLPRIRALALQDFVQLDLQGYELFEADYKAHYVDNEFNVNINQGKFELHDFQVSAIAQDKPLVKMVRFAVQGIGFNLEKHELTVESVSAHDADFKAWLNPEGVFSYQPLLPIAKAEAPPSEPVEKTAWSIKVNNIALNNCGLTFEDQTLKKPITITAKPINFKLTDYSNQAGAGLPFQLNARVNETGSITLDGNAVVEPLSAQIVVAAKDIALENFQAYVDKFARLDVIAGKLNIDGNIAVAKAKINSMLNSRAIPGLQDC